MSAELSEKEQFDQSARDHLAAGEYAKRFCENADFWLARYEGFRAGLVAARCTCKRGIVHAEGCPQAPAG